MHVAGEIPQIYRAYPSDDRNGWIFWPVFTKYAGGIHGMYFVKNNG